MNDDSQSEPQVTEERQGTGAGAFEAGEFENNPRRTLQVFRIGSQRLAIFGDEIAIVVPWRQPTPLPQAPPSVLGVVSIQGRMLTVIDPALLVDENGEHPREHILALRGDEQLGLALEQKPEAFEVAATELPSTAGAVGKLVFGIIQRGLESVSVLNVKELFPTAMRGRERRRRRF